MAIVGIKEVRIYWWLTYDINQSDFPTDVETLLRKKYLLEFNKLPDWHR